MYSEIITLLGNIEESIDEAGDIVKNQEKTEVFAKLNRIYLSETFQAMAQGYEHQARFRLSDYYDYNNQEELLYNGKKYRIVNTQRIGNEIELNCVGGVNG